MAEPFLGEIKMFAGNFAPRGWALCDGQTLFISQNDALFSLLGVQYGGDGRTTFNLPDMRGRVPLHQGHGPTLSDRSIGEKLGTENETLVENQLPPHRHTVNVSTQAADAGYPAGSVVADTGSTLTYRNATSSGVPDTDFPAGTLGYTGGGQSHTNMMPFICVNYIISLVGIYPSRS